MSIRLEDLTQKLIAENATPRPGQGTGAEKLVDLAIELGELPRTGQFAGLHLKYRAILIQLLLDNSETLARPFKAPDHG